MGYCRHGRSRGWSGGCRSDRGSGEHSGFGRTGPQALSQALNLRGRQRPGVATNCGRQPRYELLRTFADAERLVSRTLLEREALQFSAAV